MLIVNEDKIPLEWLKYFEYAHDEECPVRMLDEQTGISKSVGHFPKGGKTGKGMTYGSFNGGNNEEKHLDSGFVSRFFYIAKTSRSEKNAGLSERESQKVNDGRDTPIDNAFQRGETLRKNTHPTVKPIKLIKYLIKLVTPKGGITLDHYNGSGTAGCSVVELNKEGLDIRYIGIDREKEYIDISIERIKHTIENANLPKSDIKDQSREKDNENE